MYDKLRVGLLEKTLFRIKICGITNVPDAVAAQQFGADAIGLNFYSRSLRSVTVDQAQKVCGQLDGVIKTVGVFVNQPVDVIKHVSATCQLDMVQLHGDEPIEVMNELSQSSFPIIRAIAWTSIDQVRRDADAWLDAGAVAILLDSRRGGQFGGTGTSIDWKALSKLNLRTKTILAGGLSADNIETAISISKTQSVDCASGTEAFPGKKDHSLLQRFIANAIRAFSVQSDGDD